MWEDMLRRHDAMEGLWRMWHDLDEPRERRLAARKAYRAEETRQLVEHVSHDQTVYLQAPPSKPRHHLGGGLQDRTEATEEGWDTK